MLKCNKTVNLSKVKALASWIFSVILECKPLVCILNIVVNDIFIFQQLVQDGALSF